MIFFAGIIRGAHYESNHNQEWQYRENQSFIVFLLDLTGAQMGVPLHTKQIWCGTQEVWRMNSK